MSFVVGTRKIHCPKCHFEGTAKVKDTGMAAGCAGLACLLVSFLFFIPLIIAVPVFWIYAIFKPATLICPHCHNENPVPWKVWRSKNPETIAANKNAGNKIGMAYGSFSAKKYGWVIGLCLLMILFLYPFPRTDFLYRNAEVLNGKATQLKGASVALFLEPSFYYKFRISPSDFKYAASALGLKEQREAVRRDYDVKVMKRGPMFWNFWWWRPRSVPESVLFSGNRKGNDFYFLYDPSSQVAYLYIQNT